MTTRSFPTAQGHRALTRGANRRGPVGQIATWMQRWQTRRSLARLDARMMADAGLEPEAVAAEIAKPFWRG